MTKFCPECGTKLPYEAARFCPECGTRLNPTFDEGGPDTNVLEQDPSATQTPETGLTSVRPKEGSPLLATWTTPDPAGTDQLSFDPTKIPFGPSSEQLALEVAHLEFVPLPIELPDDAPPREGLPWRVILMSANRDLKPLALELRGDVVIGRATTGVTPDLDLGPYGGGMLGMSRRHALFRPKDDSLLLIDLASKNGTFCNGSRLLVGAGRAVRDMDVLSFAGVHFLVKFVTRPGEDPPAR